MKIDANALASSIQHLEHGSIAEPAQPPSVICPEYLKRRFLLGEVEILTGNSASIAEGEVGDDFRHLAEHRFRLSGWCFRRWERQGYSLSNRVSSYIHPDNGDMVDIEIEGEDAVTEVGDEVCRDFVDGDMGRPAAIFASEQQPSQRLIIGEGSQGHFLAIAEADAL